MDNIFLASFLGCAVALGLGFVIFRMWAIAKITAIYKAVPENVRQAFGAAGNAAEQVFAKRMNTKPCGGPSATPPPAGCGLRDFKQIADEGPGRDAAWYVECGCGWASYASSQPDAVSRYDAHVPPVGRGG